MSAHVAAGEAPLILGIAGSPRRSGNSDTLLAAALEGVVEAGARTSTLVAANAGMAPCLGCNDCAATGDCIRPDRWREVFEQLDAADGIIIASPVYFATVPGVLKVFYDRMQPYWARTHVLGLPRPPRRPGGVLLARAGGDPYGFDAAEATTRSVLAVLGIDILDVLKVSDLEGPTDASGRPQALADARVLGSAVAIEAIRRQQAH